MEDFDLHGWARIHHAAYKGIIASIDKYYEYDPNQLELETSDELHSTPLHLAIMGNKFECMKHLLKLGAKIHKRNSQGYGIVELACLRRNLPALFFFITEISQNELPTWQQLIMFLDSASDDEVDRAASCLVRLLSLDQHSTFCPDNKCFAYSCSSGVNPLWQQAIDNLLIPVCIKTLTKDISVTTKHTVLKILLPIIKAVPSARLQFGMNPIAKSAESKEAPSGVAALLLLLSELSESRDNFSPGFGSALTELMSLIVEHADEDVKHLMESDSCISINFASDFVHGILKANTLHILHQLLQRTPIIRDENSNQSGPSMEETDFDMSEDDQLANSADKNAEQSMDRCTELDWMRMWRQILIVFKAFCQFDDSAQNTVGLDSRVYETLYKFMALNQGVSRTCADSSEFTAVDRVLIKSRGFVRKNFWMTVTELIQSLCFKPRVDDTRVIFELPNMNGNNQLSLVQYGVAERLIDFCRLKSADLQLSSVQSMYAIAVGNDSAQIDLREAGAFIPLLSTLKKGLNSTDSNGHAHDSAGDELADEADENVTLSSRNDEEDEMKSAFDLSSRKTSFQPTSSVVGDSADSGLTANNRKLSQEGLIMREKVASAIWTLAGNDEDIRRLIANSIDIRMLIEFIEKIGAEALGEAARSDIRKEVEHKASQLDPDHANKSRAGSAVAQLQLVTQRQVIGLRGGVGALVSLLRSPAEPIVIAACQTLGSLCVDLGFVPQPDNQYRVAARHFGSAVNSGFEATAPPDAEVDTNKSSGSFQGHRLLIALLLHASNRSVRCEAGHCLALSLLGRDDLQQELLGQPNSKKEEIWDAVLAQLLYLMHTELSEENNEEAVEDEETELTAIKRRAHFDEAIAIRLKAAEALTTLAYQGSVQIERIGRLGGLRFQILAEICKPDKFTQSRRQLAFYNAIINPLHKCMAAFQLVILSRVIPDEEVAESTTLALHTLMDVVKQCSDKFLDASNQSKKPAPRSSTQFAKAREAMFNELAKGWTEKDRDSITSETLKLAIDCIARLAKSRPGLPEALICLNVVGHLSRALRHPRVGVRRVAAVAVNFFIEHPEAQREFLHCFRKDPYLMKLLLIHGNGRKLNAQFKESWEHCRKLGLPKCQPLLRLKQSLANESFMDFQRDPRGRPVSVCTNLTGSVDWNESLSVFDF